MIVVSARWKRSKLQRNFSGSSRANLMHSLRSATSDGLCVIFSSSFDEEEFEDSPHRKAIFQTQRSYNVNDFQSSTTDDSSCMSWKMQILDDTEDHCLKHKTHLL